MSTAQVVLDLGLLLLAALVVGYLSYRLIRRGISQKYQRPTKKIASNPWSALSHGQDPSIEEITPD